MTWAIPALAPQLSNLNKKDREMQFNLTKATAGTLSKDLTEDTTEKAVKRVMFMNSSPGFACLGAKKFDLAF